MCLCVLDTASYRSYLHTFHTQHTHTHTHTHTTAKGCSFTWCVYGLSTGYVCVRVCVTERNVCVKYIFSSSKILTIYSNTHTHTHTHTHTQAITRRHPARLWPPPLLPPTPPPYLPPLLFLLLTHTHTHTHTHTRRRGKGRGVGDGGGGGM
jgi:hypothetical protein